MKHLDVIMGKTIEYKKKVEPEFQSLLTGRALGCDICADVCPWNKKWAKQHQHPELAPVEAIGSWESADWQLMTPEVFSKTFKSSAIQRAGFRKLKENIDIVTENKQSTS